MLMGEGDLVAPVEAALLSGGEVGEGEVAFGLIMALENPEFEIERRKTMRGEVGEGVGVAEGFGDFGAVDGEEVAMQPKAGERNAKSGLGLGDFVGVMDGDVVNATSVDIDGLAEGGMDDRGAFEVPAWVAWAAEIVPAHGVMFVRLDEFPESKVGGMALGVAEFDAGTGLEMLEVEMGEVGVMGEFAGIEIDAVRGFVGITEAGEAVDEGLVGRDVIGGASGNVGSDEVKGAKITEKFFDIVIGNLPNGLVGRAGTLFEFVFAIVSVRGKVADIGEIEDAVGGELVGLEDAQKEIPIDVGSEIADVGGAINSGATGVDFDFGGVLGAKSFDSASEGIVEAKWGGVGVGLRVIWHWLAP